MQITEHVYAKKMVFAAATPAGVLVRDVHVYLIAGSETSCLIDTGVYPGLADVLQFIAECGKRPADISQILITHAHADHIGALKSLKAALSCTAAASKPSTRWIEDVDAQFKERPVPNFKDFVEGSVQIEHELKNAERVRLGESTLKAYEAPGHEAGQLAFFHEEDGVLFAADCIPIPGEMPVYDDVAAQVSSLKRLREIEGVQVLLMSWADAIEGDEAAKKALDDGLEYVARIHALTAEGLCKYGENDFDAVAKFVHAALGLPPSAYNLLFTSTIKAHINEKNLAIGL